jgi:cell division protein FtsB
MNVDLGILGKLTRVVVFLLFIAGVLAVGVWYFPLIKRNEPERKQLLDREEQIRKVEDANRQLKASIESLKHDPKAVERLARERLGYAKPGETVIRFEERPSTASR